MLILKIGGSMANNAASLAADIAKLGQKLVIVHGGGPQVTALEKGLGREPKYINSKQGFKSRHTDGVTMQNFVMAVGGGVNISLVRQLRKAGVSAAGISGVSGVLFAKRKTLISFENRKEKIIRDDYSGKIIRTDATALRALLSAGLVPVVSPIALGQEFEALNVDGDRAAAAIGAELSAEKLILFTDVEGYFKNFQGAKPPVSPTAGERGSPTSRTAAAVQDAQQLKIPNDLVGNANQKDISEFQKGASSGMKRKLVATNEALSGGVKEVIICSGTREKPVTSALSGGGTHFTK